MKKLNIDSISSVLKRTTPILIPFFLLLIAATGFQNSYAKNGDEALDRIVAEVFALDATPGMAVSVVAGNEIMYSKEFGFADLESRRPVTTETMFYIASTTKSFTAFVVALLDNRGRLNLDNPLNVYLPELDLKPPLSEGNITLRHLLTHTHGIESGGPVVFRTAYSGVHSHNQLIELLSEYEPAPSGKAYNYGNIGYNIASLAMDAHLDGNWKDVLRKEIFEPLNMNNTSAYLSKVDNAKLAMPYMANGQGYRKLYYAKSDENMHAAGGHVSTALDLAKWLKLHINLGKIDDRQVFPKKVVLETQRKQVDQDREFGQYHRFGWGLGWDLGAYDGDTLLHRFGSFAGFRSHVSFMPQHDIGVVVLVNEGYLGFFLADMVANSIYDYLLKKRGFDEKFQKRLNEFRKKIAQRREQIQKNVRERTERSQVLPHPLTAYTGIYENNKLGKMQWRVVNDKLEVSMGLLWSEVEFYDSKKNQFRVELTGSGEVVSFNIRGNHAASLTYRDHKFMRVEP